MGRAAPWIFIELQADWIILQEGLASPKEGSSARRGMNSFFFIIPIYQY